jgi:calcineurin-like phosphoesterase family protein
MANEVWFTSDTHFGHRNILEYEKEGRPFSDVEEMNETLISNWNETVSPKDIVWHLGDFAFGRVNIELASRLHGKKRLVMGNHDVYSNSIYLDYFDKLFGVHYWNMCVLSHIPVHPSNLGGRAFLNVHGHLHSKLINESEYDDTCESCMSYYGHRSYQDRNYFNVSCEQHNLRPVNSSVIMDRLKDITE